MLKKRIKIDFLDSSKIHSTWGYIQDLPWPIINKVDYSFNNSQLNEVYLQKKSILDFTEREKQVHELTKIKFLDDVYRSYFHRNLLYYFFTSNCIYGCIFDKEKLIFEYGDTAKYSDVLRNFIEKKSRGKFDDSPNQDILIKPVILDSQTLHDNNLFCSISCLKDTKAEIFFVENRDLKLNQNSVAIIHSLIKRFYLNLPGKVDNRYRDFFSEFEARFLSQVNSFSFENHSGIIANFYIQDLKAYFQAMGEHRSGEILEEIRLIILSYLKKGDLLFRISPRAFLTYSHNCNIETVKHRFDDVYFQIKNLIVDYEIFFYPVSRKINSTEEFWQKIFPPGLI